MTDTEFKTDSRVSLKKPVFFFGDNIGEDGSILHNGDYKWLRQIGNRKFFLPNMERMCNAPIPRIRRRYGDVHT